MRESRRERILALLETGEDVDVGTLARTLSVSQATVRRDLDSLERDGSLIRTYGGAIIRKDNLFKPTYVARMRRNLSEKRAIARAAAALISDRETLMLCNGTTTNQIARLLHNNPLEITVITNAVDSALELTRNPRIRTIIIGGEISETYTIGGFLGEKMLEQIGQVDRIFVGADGVDLTHGLTAYSSADAHINGAMMQVAGDVVLVADHTKFGKVKLAPMASLERVNTIITSSLLPLAAARQFEEQGVKVVRVPLEEARAHGDQRQPRQERQGRPA